MAIRSLETTSTPSTSSLWEVASVFLKLGTTAFGGPAAHVAMMHEEIVRRRHWITEQEFLDYLSAANFIPGPNSTEMAIHIGRRRAGWPGLIVAGASFIIPAALLVGVLAWAYVKFGKLPQVAGLLYGVKPVVIAIILQALWKLGRSAIATKWLALVSVFAVALTLAGVNELLVLVAGGCWLQVSIWCQSSEVSGLVARCSAPRLFWPGRARLAWQQPVPGRRLAFGQSS